MRLRIILLVVAASSLVLVSFLVPLALVLRTLAADRAVSSATVQAQWMAPLVATLRAGSLRVAVAQVNAQGKTTPVTGHGVARAWLLLGCVGGLLALSVAVADQLARSLVRPLADVARASDRLATGDLSARARLAGPPEVRRAGAGLNRLALRIGELLADERETVADWSHRLRTPMTALRIDAESLRDHAEQTQMLSDLDALEHTVDEVIRAARRPTGDGALGLCDAAAVVAERAAFWLPLAEDTDRAMTIELASGELPVRVSGDELGACMDILLENVFAHTPDGAALAIRLSRRAEAARGWWSRTTGRGSAAPTRPSAAGPAVGLPGSAWISRAGSRNLPAGR